MNIHEEKGLSKINYYYSAYDDIINIIIYFNSDGKNIPKGI